MTKHVIDKYNALKALGNSNNREYIKATHKSG